VLLRTGHLNNSNALFNALLDDLLHAAGAAGPAEVAGVLVEDAVR
jgi:hypothetical protein